MADIEDVKQIFERVTNNSTYLRASDTHPLEIYLGLNMNGLKTLRYNGKFTPSGRITGNNSLIIKQVKTSYGHSIFFSFDPSGGEDIELFYKLCEDVINYTADSKSENGYRDIINRFNQWKKLFAGKKKTLSESEIQGLIAELLFLESDIIPQYGDTEGLNAWDGPDAAKKDFSVGNAWFEIKSVSGSKTTVTISSAEQLDSAGDCSGMLVVYRLEKMSPQFQGCTLNALVMRIRHSFAMDIDRDLFDEKMAMVGYAYDEAYDSYVYRVTEICRYNIEDNFPLIKRGSLRPGIVNIRYDIELSSIEEYRER